MGEYVYTFAGTEAKIHTPFCSNLNEIINEFTQTPECIQTISKYPNGFVIEMNQYADMIIVKTNKRLLANQDGTFSVEP